MSEILFCCVTHRIFLDTEEERGRQTRSNRFVLITRIPPAIRLTVESGWIRRNRSRFFLARFFSSTEIARGHENDSDGQTSGMREAVTRERYFYESRGIRPKPAHFHVLFSSLLQ